MSRQRREIGNPSFWSIVRIAFGGEGMVRGEVRAQLVALQVFSWACFQFQSMPQFDIETSSKTDFYWGDITLHH